MPLTSNGRNLVSEYVAKLGQNMVNYLWTSTYGLRPWLLNKTQIRTYSSQSFLIHCIPYNL